VYRKTFSKNSKIELLLSSTNKNVPSEFSNSRIIDVTSQYIPVTNVQLRLTKIPNKEKYLYACIFNDNGWTAMDFAKIENENSCQFFNLGRDVMYFPMYFNNGNYTPASLPFKISKKGYIEYINPEKETITVRLSRKYHMYKNKVNWLQCLTNSWFEGANNSNFSDAVVLAKINSRPGEHFQTLISGSNNYFKYIRLVFSPKELNISYDGDGASIAEIEFLTPKGSIIKGIPIGSQGRKYNSYTATNCFDNNPYTFFEDARPDAKIKYVGLQLAKPMQIGAIRFLPRNDMNSVQPNNQYELFYWNNKEFISLGRKISKDTIIEYNNVPKNSILWLRNTDTGKEERIFTWENNKQVWW
jgi:hypothetical protein